MQSDLKGYRTLVLVGLLLLALLFGLMVSKLFSELRDLSVPEDAIFSRWNSFQFETDFANLEVALIESIADEDLSKDNVRQRMDIVLRNIVCF